MSCQNARPAEIIMRDSAFRGGKEKEGRLTACGARGNGPRHIQAHCHRPLPLLLGYCMRHRSLRQKYTVWTLGRQLGSKVFEICCLKVPLLAWAAGQLQYSGTLRKHVAKPSGQVAAPVCMGEEIEISKIHAMRAVMQTDTTNRNYGPIFLKKKCFP